MEAIMESKDETGEMCLFFDDELIKEMRKELLKSRILWTLKEKFKESGGLAECRV